jgi:hypothetical protein
LARVQMDVDVNPAGLDCERNTVLDAFFMNHDFAIFQCG